MSLEFLGLETIEQNEHRIAWDAKDWDRVKELCSEFEKDKTQSVFDILANVTEKKGYKNVLEFDDYNQYLINNALSQHPHMIGYASELNLIGGYITDQMHYDYLYHTVRKCKLPFVKFAKVSGDWEYMVMISVLADYYESSKEKAEGFVEILGEEKLEKIKRIIKVFVDSPNSKHLSMIPTKKEKEQIYNMVKKW